MNKTKLLTVAIIITLTLSIGLISFDQLGWGVGAEKSIQYPMSNNYDVSPPEIKNYEDKLEDG